MTDLQTAVGRSADRAEAHSTAPALILQLQASLGRLAATTDEATEGGRRAYRVPSHWAPKLGELGYLVYLLADQTGVPLDETIRAIAEQVSADADRRAAQQSSDDDRSWI